MTIFTKILNFLTGKKAIKLSGKYQYTNKSEKKTITIEFFEDNKYNIKHKINKKEIIVSTGVYTLKNDILTINGDEFIVTDNNNFINIKAANVVYKSENPKV
jgi:hypothetical protein